MPQILFFELIQLPFYSLVLLSLFGQHRLILKLVLFLFSYQSLVHLFEVPMQRIDLLLMMLSDLFVAFEQSIILVLFVY
jgi:hypothetical protein